MKKIILVIGGIALGFYFTFYTATSWRGQNNLDSIERTVDDLVDHIRLLDYDKSELITMIEKYSIKLNIEEEKVAELILDLTNLGLDHAGSGDSSSITFREVQEELDRLHMEVEKANEDVEYTRNKVNEKAGDAMRDNPVGVRKYVSQATYDAWVRKLDN